MIYAILGPLISALVGVCLFIVPMWAYRRGLRDGMAITAGKPIEPIRMAVPQISRPPPAEPDLVAQGLANILAYDGSSQEEAKDK